MLVDTSLVYAFIMMTLTLLGAIPRTEATANNTDDGLVIFAPLTKAAKRCYVQGGVSSYNCSTCPRCMLTLRRQGRTKIYEMKKNEFTYIASISYHKRCSIARLLNLVIMNRNNKPISMPHLQIRDNRLEFWSSFSKYDVVHGVAFDVNRVYEVALVYNGTHFVFSTTGLIFSWRSANKVVLADHFIGEISIGGHCTDYPPLHVSCVQWWNKALREDEIADERRACNKKWRLTEVVNDTGVFANISTSANKIAENRTETTTANVSSTCVTQTALDRLEATLSNVLSAVDRLQETIANVTACNYCQRAEAAVEPLQTTTINRGNDSVEANTTVHVPAATAQQARVGGENGDK